MKRHTEEPRAGGSACEAEEDVLDASAGRRKGSSLGHARGPLHRSAAGPRGRASHAAKPSSST
eukprot:9343545-Alexandrium_andersonii.AAC.1